MVQPQKTPLQHNSTLFISPQIGSRRANVFITPPNPHHKLFDTPGTLLSLFYDPDHVSGHIHEPVGGLAQNMGEEPLSRAEKLRLWRHDAWMQHHYETAEYIGDKILTLTNDANDAFWLAQVYFARGEYLRAHKLLASKSAYEQSLSCRYLSAYSLIKLERWEDALDLLGETNPFKDNSVGVGLGLGHEKTTNTDGGTRLEASMCYLRGLVYANQSNYEKARDAYKEAVMVDVKCFEAFDQLVRNDFLSPREQWEFVRQLNYTDADDNDELIRLLYTTRLSKYVHVTRYEEAEGILKDEYRLGESADVLLSKADYLYIQCNYDECLRVCEQVLDRDPHNFSVLPNYLSCLYELGGRNKLFLKAHQLADNHPSHPLTWLAIGIYYLSIHRVLEARKFFSKATLLNPNNGQGWIGFGHTFALEGEHEQAISAYAFAARLFPGTHLPNLFLGMQHLQMNSISLAEEYLLAAYHICNTDPLLLNEMGVIHYHKNDLLKAEALFLEALGAAKYLNSDSKTWISIHSNLGHVFRRSNHPYKALDCFNQALKLSPQNDSNILSSMGLVYMKLGNDHKAIQVLHDALAISPADPVAQDLLKRALQTNKNSPLFLNSMDSKISDIHISARRSRADILADTAPSSNRFATPLHRKVKNISSDSSTKSKFSADGIVDTLAEDLKRGEVSSDEEVMDIESD